MLFSQPATRWSLLCCVAALLACSFRETTAKESHAVPTQFESYAVPLRKITKFAPTKIQSEGVNWKMEGYLHFSDGGPPDFANKYTVFSIGCGISCVEFCLIDRTTGIVHPGMSFNQHFLADYEGPTGLIYRRDSRLLIVYHAALGEPIFADYYVWDGAKFILLRQDKIQEWGSQGGEF